MSGDIQRLGMAANFLLQNMVCGAMLLAQCALVFLLAPALALVALAVLTRRRFLVVPVVRRAHGLGGMVQAPTCRCSIPPGNSSTRSS